MNFVKLEDYDSQEFKEAWKIYESSFPLDEKRTFEVQKKILRNNLYDFFAVKKNDTLVAIITVWRFQEFLFIEHLAVIDFLRGKGVGTDLLKEYLSKTNEKIVLEVELPNTETATKRINFYEKIGFKLNSFNYIQPPYGKEKNHVPMILMSYPQTITELEFILIRDKLHRFVYEYKK